MIERPEPLIYHVTPITPDRVIRAVRDRLFLVSFNYRQQDALMDEIAAGVIFDNGAYRAHTKGSATNWPGFYEWTGRRLHAGPDRWAVIPDVIGGGAEENDALIAQWPHGEHGAPVWHTDEPIGRFLDLASRWPIVCIGSAALHPVGSDVWRTRLDQVDRACGDDWPDTHMLKGVAVARLYPFRSADSSSLAQNHHRYRQPLFAGTDDEHSGVVAYADKLERGAA